MKTFTFYGLAVILLLGLTTSAFAQSNIVTAEQAEIINSMNRQTYADARIQSMVRSLLNGSEMGLFVSGFLRQEDFREGVGVSQEQNQKIQEGLRNIDQAAFTQGESDPDYKLLVDADQELRRSFSEAVMSNAALDVLEEIREARLDLQIQMSEMRSEKRANLFNEVLTPDQWKRIQEYYISTMSYTNYVFPQMFEALDLSDEQREQFEDIKKNIEPEFVEHIAKQVEHETRSWEKLNELAMELESIRDWEERQRLFEDIRKKVREEFQPERNALLESGKGLADRLKSEMFDVLTDEQWARMVDLIDNPPDYVKRVIARTREALERTDSSTGTTGGWQPGPGSWQPGDGIPEGYRIQRETRRQFPRGEE